MIYLVVPDKSEFDRFASGQVIEAKVMLGWFEREDYAVGMQVDVWYQARDPDNPCFVGEIVEDLGIVEFVVEDNNIHCFRVRKV